MRLLSKIKELIEYGNKKRAIEMAPIDQIEKKVTENAKNGTDDMFIEVTAFKSLSWIGDRYHTEYTLIHKGQPVCAVSKTYDAYYREEGENLELFFNNTRVEDADNDTINEIWNAFDSIYDKQQEIKAKIQQKKEEEEKNKKLAAAKQNASTFFNNLGKTLFGKGEQR